MRWGRLAIGALLASLVSCGLGLTGQRDVEVTGNDAASPTLPDGAEGGSSPQPDGATPGDAATDAFDAGPYATRVTSGLVGLWELEEDGGATVHDTTPSPLDLTIDDTSRVTWKPHALELTDYVEITSGSTNFAKAKAACTSEFTAETWVESAKNGENDYARIVWWGSSSSRNLALGTYRDDTWWASMHASEDLQQGSVTTSLTHFVGTRASDGTLTSYVNGTSVGTLGTSGGFSDYPLTLGNVTGGGRGFRGTLHLVAIYCRALTPAEVKTNFAAGADP